MTVTCTGLATTLDLPSTRELRRRVRIVWRSGSVAIYLFDGGRKRAARALVCIPAEPSSLCLGSMVLWAGRVPIAITEGEAIRIHKAFEPLGLSIQHAAPRQPA